MFSCASLCGTYYFILLSYVPHDFGASVAKKNDAVRAGEPRKNWAGTAMALLGVSDCHAL